MVANSQMPSTALTHRSPGRWANALLEIRRRTPISSDSTANPAKTPTTTNPLMQRIELGASAVTRLGVRDKASQMTTNAYSGRRQRQRASNPPE